MNKEQQCKTSKKDGKVFRNIFFNKLSFRRCPEIPCGYCVCLLTNTVSLYLLTNPCRTEVMILSTNQRTTIGSVCTFADWTDLHPPVEMRHMVLASRLHLPQLPQELRTSQSVMTFKSILKTYLFIYILYICYCFTYIIIYFFTVLLYSNCTAVTVLLSTLFCNFARKTLCNVLLVLFCFNSLSLQHLLSGATSDYIFRRCTTGPLIINKNSLILFKRIIRNAR